MNAESGRRSAGVDDLVAVVKNSLCKSRGNPSLLNNDLGSHVLLVHLT